MGRQSKNAEAETFRSFVVVPRSLASRSRCANHPRRYQARSARRSPYPPAIEGKTIRARHLCSGVADGQGYRSCEIPRGEISFWTGYLRSHTEADAPSGMPKTQGIIAYTEGLEERL